MVSSVACCAWGLEPGRSGQPRSLSPRRLLPCQNIGPNLPVFSNVSREARNWILIIKSNFQRVANPNFSVAKCTPLAASRSGALYESGGNLASLVCWPQHFVLCLLVSLSPMGLVQWLTVSITAELHRAPVKGKEVRMSPCAEFHSTLEKPSMAYYSYGRSVRAKSQNIR